MSLPSKDFRHTHRRRTRLRSGKLLDRTLRFVSDCSIHDRSPQGARIVLARDIPSPSSFCLYDDELDVVFDIKVIWRQGRQWGLRFEGFVELPPARRKALLGRYYAL